jgi:glutamyl-tRNA synthetase
VCGRIEFDLSNPDTHPDMTIRRPDGSWIFHFVNVVDDIEMRITHVIRGEDHLSNTPKHLELYSALGAQPPCFAHIPLILNLDGTKMSKRDKGAAVHEYIEGGYAPEAVRNFLCLLGWSPKDDREKLDINEVIAHFDLQQINRKAARFDIQKCDWLNAQYLMHMPLERLVELAIPFAEKAGIPFESPARLGAALTLVREKLKHLTDLPKWIDYYFMDAFEIEAEAREKTLARDGVFDRLDALADAFSAVGNWTAPELETALKQLATGAGIKPAEYIHPARAAVSGRTYGASLYHMLEFLGRERVLARLGSARTRFAPPV